MSSLKKIDCDLCNMATIKSGKDTILYEDESCYIVDNGNTDGYTRRISLTIKPHFAGTDMTFRIASYNLIQFLNTIGIGDGYFIKKTMNTYPDHFHIHAYILPELSVASGG